MIVRIRGILSELTEESAVVERDGLAYEALVPAYAVSELAAGIGGEVTLHTMEYLEATSPGGNMTPRLIGFLRPEDRAFFRLFTTVKGLGTRKGLRALIVPAARIALDIERGDASALVKLPGIGRRLSEQIIAELRGKVTEHAVVAGPAAEGLRPEFTEEQQVAVEIITQWGDPRSDAQRWMARAVQLNRDVTGPDEWVKAAYRVKNGSDR